MILRRTGSSVAAVAASFNAAAFNEIAFHPQPGFRLSWAEFECDYERVRGHVLVARSEGDVKLEAEAALLAELLELLHAAERACAPDELLLLESQAGRDYPRLHDRTDTLVVEDRNRLYFHYTIDPPLRLGVYRRRGARP